ncbi:MAG: sulfite reductase, ferredoxin dependent [Oscillatoriales cyanobacterium]|nr:MAG: sulfite reductase, ferredoxin dependent [Oscillatoriales cyanobacterium]
MITSSISTPATRKPSKSEGLKERSNYLREPVATELLQDTTHFTEEGIQILKFHGSYQQDNRDNRVKGQEKDYQFMLRTRNPGGFVPPELFLALDKLSEEYGNQFSSIIKNMGSTLGACGDLNRNVMAPPAPYKNRPEYQYALEYANNVADLLTPQTGAYYEIWLDGEKAISAEEDPAVKAARQSNGNGTTFHDKEEPIYGQHYMPRKFKCSVTVPGDNSIDLYSQDLSLVVITNASGELQGFDVFAGGGLGRTHNKEETFARVADEICYVAKDDVYDLVKAIVATQRDCGDRTDRRHARLKYLINDKGVKWFSEKVAEYFGKPLEAFKPLPEWKYFDFLGWHEQGDGKLFVGISVENGRIKDEGSFQLKTALREIVQKYNLPLLVTPHQNVTIYDISPDIKSEIQGILDRSGIQAETAIDPLVRYSMACPAMPTCGLAITESERVIPSILERIRASLTKVGLEDEHFVVRMTGCPNGCARPYMAELGFVGSSPESYQIWLGGSPSQTREPIFVYFKQKRQQSESFGDFCDRVGLESIRQFVTNHQSADSMTTEINELDVTSSNGEENETATAGGGKVRRRISVRDEIYNELKEEAARQGKPITQLATEAISTYLKKIKEEGKFRPK